MSWSSNDGLTLYVNGQEADQQEQPSIVRERRSTRETKAFVGRSNEGGRREHLNDAVVDDLDIYYGTREMLSQIGFIKTGNDIYSLLLLF